MMKWYRKLLRWLKGDVIIRPKTPTPERDKLIGHKVRSLRNKFPGRNI